MRVGFMNFIPSIHWSMSSFLSRHKDPGQLFKTPMVGVQNAHTVKGENWLSPTDDPECPGTEQIVVCSWPIENELATFHRA